jgi:hypothetical protein
MKYYTEEEMIVALQRATRTINLLTEACTEYTRGTNDCFALLVEYDSELRGKSKARDYVKFRWKTTKEFVVKLARGGYSLSDYMEYCGYEIVTNKRPLLGDIAFEDGAMINDGDFWVSTTETNKGVDRKRQTHFLERRVLVLARPIRS